MHPFFAFLLFLTITVAISQLFSNPFDRLIKKFEGKNMSEISAEGKQWVDDTPIGIAIVKVLSGCLSYGCWIGLALLVFYVLEPLLIITALVSRVGLPLLGYLAFAIWFMALFRRILSSKKIAEKNKNSQVDAEKLKLEKLNWRMIWAERVFFFLPDVYLAYVFLVSIGLIGPAG